MRKEARREELCESIRAREMMKDTNVIGAMKNCVILSEW